MLILGIETSCDDTGIAIYEEKKGIISNELYSQTKLYKKYGGIVPELASRNHAKIIIPLIKKTFKNSILSLQDVNGIAYTAGPGLVGSLLIGATVSHALAYSINVPAIPINHMEGHLLSIMLKEKSPSFPFIALLVSGGHTQIIQAYDFGKYKLLGQSIDDAAGEALDKIARLLDISPPDGSNLEKLARQGKEKNFFFPKPMIDKNLNFSFSGLKTYASKIIKKYNINKQTCCDIALAFENSIIEMLVRKCYLALKFTGYKKLVIAGGVSANLNLRNNFENMIKKIKGQLFFSRTEFCTDNGAMIAYVGMMRLKKNKFLKKNFNIQVYPKWKITDLQNFYEKF